MYRMQVGKVGLRFLAEVCGAAMLFLIGKQQTEPQDVGTALGIAGPEQKQLVY